MASKIIYRHRISDNVYTIYKLSPYSQKPIIEVEAGLAFNKHGGWSKELLNAIEKYGISKLTRGSWITADSYSEPGKTIIGFPSLLNVYL